MYNVQNNLNLKVLTLHYLINHFPSSLFLFIHLTKQPPVVHSFNWLALQAPICVINIRGREDNPPTILSSILISNPSCPFFHPVQPISTYPFYLLNIRGREDNPPSILSPIPPSYNLLSNSRFTFFHPTCLISTNLLFLFSIQGGRQFKNKFT